MADPAIIMGGAEGFHNLNGKETRKRLKEGKQYRDLSTVCVIPTRGMIPARVVESWWNMMLPMNNQFIRLMVRGMEVGEAYNHAFQLILDHPQLSKFKYVLTLEDDNMPPSDGLLKLYENIDDWAVLAGLYYTKGFGGQPMIYGEPKEMLNFRPQVPKQNTIQEAHGLGMGFNLWKLEIFRDKRFEKPWFKTEQEGGRQYSQDLYAYEKLRKLGYRVACDTRIRVGHFDSDGDFVW